MARNDDPKSEPQATEILSRKDLAKKLRHDAYQAAKARRATDPKFLALKERLKLQRREAYQKVKARAKTQKDERRREADEKAAREREAKDRELMEMVVPARKLKLVPPLGEDDSH
jgi:hypothetical protein